MGVCRCQELREAALDFVMQVQSELLSKDANLADFDLGRLGRLLEILRPVLCERESH